MKKDHKNIVQRSQVLLVLSLYLFIALTNIFLVANSTFVPNSQEHQYALKAAINNGPIKNTVIRADKAIIKESSKGLPQEMPVLSFSYYSGRNIIAPARLGQLSVITPAKAYTRTYLTLLNLRI